MADSLFGGTIDLLGKSMDIRSRRHAVLSSNIANAETPGYKTKDISFENELSKAMDANIGDMKRTHSKHLSGNTGSMITAHTANSEGTLRNDDNDVSVDEEMSKLSQNTLQYDTSAQILAKKFAGLKYAVSEGRR